MVHLSEVLTAKDMETQAMIVLPKGIRNYFQCGADDEQTAQQNKEAFDRFLFIPRVMIDPTNLSMKTTIIGQTFGLPFGFAPCAMNKLAHPEGEIAVARAAHQNDMMMVLSTLSTTPLETVAENAGGVSTSLWFQLYLYQNRTLSAALLQRVEKAGYKAIVLTIDSPVFGRRLLDMRNRFQLPPHLKLPNFEGFRATDAPMSSNELKYSPIFHQLSEHLDPSLTWEAVEWLKKNTKLPVWVKGIMSSEDADLAIKSGADGIIISNHGGRQLDSVPATIEVLPLIAKKVSERVPIIVDGGIRRGGDVIKALALGANMVLIGRPVLHALAVAGYDGVSRLVQILKDETARVMALSGITDVTKISRSLVVHRRSLENRL